MTTPVFVEGADEVASQFAAVLAISLQSIKQYHDEKVRQSQLHQECSAGQHPARGHLCQGPGAALCHRCCPGWCSSSGWCRAGDISAYDVVSSLFPDKQKDFVFKHQRDRHRAGQGDSQGHRPRGYGKAGRQHRGHPCPGEHYIKAVVGIGTPISNVKEPGHQLQGKPRSPWRSARCSTPKSRSSATTTLASPA